MPTEFSNEKRLGSRWRHLCLQQPWLPALVALTVIVAVEVLTFWAPYKKTGFYLDDWLMLRQLSFGPQNYFELVYQYLTTDPRVIIRPVEALHFGTVFYFSGSDPTGWRLSNMLMEILSGFLVFLIVARLSLSRTLGLIASLFVISYPSHDSTHYWAVCSCVSLSLTLYLASLWATLKAACPETPASVSTGRIRKRAVWLGFAYFCYAASIFGYEPFLPLCALNVVAYVFLSFGFKPVVASVGKLFVHSLPYAAMIASLLVYQRMIAPLFLKVALHKVHLEPVLMLGTIAEGLRVSTLATVPFIAGQVNSFVQSQEMNAAALLRLGLLALIIILGVVATLDIKQVSRRTALLLLVLGLFATVVSYSIFGLNPEYTPTLITLVNRINMGAAFGLSIVVAGLAALLIASGPPPGKFFRLFAGTAIFTAGLCAFTLANWNLSRPWQISWSVQKMTFDAFKQRKAQFETTSSILLVDCPRYVDATPVFDGTWDFEEGLHLALGRRDIKGGVVSERLVVGPDSVQDVTMGFACAEYPFKDMCLVTPGLRSVTVIAGPRHFVDSVERQAGTFQLAPDALGRWRSQIEFGTRRKKNGVLEAIHAQESDKDKVRKR